VRILEVLQAPVVHTECGARTLQVGFQNLDAPPQLLRNPRVVRVGYGDVCRVTRAGQHIMGADLDDPGYVSEPHPGGADTLTRCRERSPGRAKSSETLIPSAIARMRRAPKWRPFRYTSTAIQTTPTT
jgi:hypothetical protein